MRGGNLEAKFVDLGSKTRREFIVRFPSHSHTTHEVTILSIIRSCVDWETPKDIEAWHDAKAEVIFSLPQDAEGYNGSYEHYSQWFLVSLKLPSAK